MLNCLVQYRSVILNQFSLDSYLICAYHNLPMAIERGVIFLLL
jgi:hypothetical protein